MVSVGVPIVTAVIGAAAVVVAAFLGNSGRLAGTLPGAPVQTVTPVAATVTVTGAASGTATVTAPPSTPAGVWHEGDFTIARGVQVDLDAPPDDRHWGQFDELPGAIEELSYSGSLIGQGGLVLKDRATPCQEATGYGFINVPPSAGTVICMRTRPDGRFARIEIRAKPNDDQLVNVHITTFKNATDG
jgi:hypothetical protein